MLAAKRKTPNGNATHLFVLQFIQYAVLTAQVSMIAHLNYVGVFVTDMIFAALGFTVLKKVAEATTPREMWAYALGGAVGSQVALLWAAHIH